MEARTRGERHSIFDVFGPGYILAMEVSTSMVRGPFPFPIAPEDGIEKKNVEGLSHAVRFL